MVTIVTRYKISYETRESFVEGITNWVLNPVEEKALMRGAVLQFKVMHKQPFNKNAIITIVEYIYYNELETPSWFEAHFNEEHPNGMGNRMGNGKRNRKRL